MRYPAIEIGCANILDTRFDARVDIQSYPAVNFRADMRDLSIFANNTFAFLKCAASIEHIAPDDQVRAVREFHRILVPHGVAHIQTPDLTWIESSYQNGTITEEWYFAQKNGGHRDEFDKHLGLLDKDSIIKLFTDNGFRILQLHEGNEAGGSLDVLVEAVK